MTSNLNQALLEEILEDFASHGINQLKKSLSSLFSQLMLVQIEEVIGALPYKKSSDRKGHCNGL